MNAPAFTPPPWHIVSHGDGDSLVICDDEEAMWRICFMATPGSAGSFEKIQANACLIAAAPELYASLLELLEPLERASAELVAHGKVADENAEAAFDRARAAIRKARGEQQ